MEHINLYLTNLPAQIDLITMAKFAGYIAAGVLIVGLLARIILGKRSGLNHSLSSAMGILCIYALTIVIYSVNPHGLRTYLSPLPFVRFQEHTLAIFAFQEMDLYAICYEVLSMVILAFLVNLLDSWIPKGKRILGWYFLRFTTVLLAMALHYGVTWAIGEFLPGTLVTYAPIILLGILAAMLMLGLLNVILSLVLTVVNPIIGALYAFFFSNILGKHITKAVVTTIILCLVVVVLNYYGYVFITISVTALGTYLPLVATLLVLWYIIGHIL